MNHNPIWYSLFQSPLIPNMIAPATVNWNFPQPMEIQITTQLNVNNNYHDITKDFIEKYTLTSSLDLACISHYYHTDALISLHIHHETNNHLFEIVGHNNFKNKMTELNLSTIKYNNLVCTAQPIGKNKILTTMHGRVELNSKFYNMINTFIVKIIGGSPRIINQVLEIFV